MERAEIRLANGDVVNVQGSLQEVEKALSDAARSGQSRLAWFNEPGADRRVGVNPAQVMVLRVGKD